MYIHKIHIYKYIYTHTSSPDIDTNMSITLGRNGRKQNLYQLCKWDTGDRETGMEGKSYTI